MRRGRILVLIDDVADRHEHETGLMAECLLFQLPDPIHADVRGPHGRGDHSHRADFGDRPQMLSGVADQHRVEHGIQRPQASTASDVPQHRFQQLPVEPAAIVKLELFARRSRRTQQGHRLGVFGLDRFEGRVAVELRTHDHLPQAFNDRIFLPVVPLVFLVELGQPGHGPIRLHSLAFGQRVRPRNSRRKNRAATAPPRVRSRSAPGCETSARQDCRTRPHR